MTALWMRLRIWIAHGLLELPELNGGVGVPGYTVNRSKHGMDRGFIPAKASGTHMKQGRIKLWSLARGFGFIAEEAP
jgi:hypothetical protein